MKAKKLISIVLLAAMGTSAQAQIVTSVTDQVVVIEQPKPIKEKKPKKPRTFKWNIRAGYSFDKMTGADDMSFISGFDGSFGISKPFRNERLFWGVEAGYMTYGAHWKTYNSTCIGHVISLNPRIGIKFPIGQKMSLNLYGGPYIGGRIGGDADWIWTEDAIGYDYTDASGHKHHRKDSREDHLEIDDGIDVGINIGAEFFVTKNIYFDLHFRKGFLSSGERGWWQYGSDYDQYLKHWENWDNSDAQNISALKIVLGIGVQF